MEKFIFLCLITFLFNATPAFPKESKWWEGSTNQKAGFYFENGNNLFKSGNYNGAAFNYISASNIYSSAKNWEKYFDAIFCLGECYYNLKNFIKADYYFNKAEITVLKYFKNNQLYLSRVYSARSFMLFEKKEYNTSISLAKKSIEIRKNKNGESDSLLTYPYYALGLNYYTLGKFSLAIEYYYQSLQTALLMHDKTNNFVYSNLYNMGSVYWYTGAFDNAMDYYNKAMFVQNRKLSNGIENAYTYNGIGTMYLQIGNYYEAKNYFSKAQKKINSIKPFNKALSAVVSFNQALVFFRNSDYDKSINLFEEALGAFGYDSTSNNATYTYLANYYLGKAYTAIGNTGKALSYYKKSLEISNTHNFGDNQFTYYFLAKTYQELGKNQKADSLFEKAVVYYTIQGNPVSLAKCLVNYGEFCTVRKKHQKAMNLFTKALTIFTKTLGEKNINTALALNSKGELYLDMCDYDNALICFQKSLISSVKKFNSRNLNNNPSPADLSADISILKPLKGKAFALYQKASVSGNDTALLAASLKCYSLAISSVEKLKHLYGATESASTLLEKENKTYDNALEVAAKLYARTNNVEYFKQAFTIAEKSKSSLLLSILRNNEALQFAKIPVALQDYEKDLRKQIGQYQQLVSDEHKSTSISDKKIAYWNDQLLNLKSKHESLVLYLEQFYPDYYNLKYNTAVLNSDSVKKRLSGSEALIEYARTDQHIYAFLISQKQQKIIFFDADSSFDHALTNYNRYLKNSATNPRIYCSSSYGLYQKLIKPFDTGVKGKSLIIIPDEELYSLPFETLVTDTIATEYSSYRNLPYLITRSSVTYAASATLLFGSNNQNSTNSMKLLAFAPSYENVSDLKTTDAETRQLVRELKPLTGAKEEVEGIREITGGDVFSGKEATVTNFKNSYKNYSILHFAMHTLVDDQNPMNSSLVFNADDQGNCLLNSGDLYGMNLNAKLAVLSACNTGNGKIKKGEGMLCLARGFMYAGCPDLIITLWDINDKSGALIMKSFYKYLFEGKSKNDALRLAKLDYLRNSDNVKANPYYWAGYINFGNYEPICEEENKSNIIFPSSIKVMLWLIPLAGILIFRKRIIFMTTSVLK